MDFFDKAFDAIANAATKASVIDFKIFAIIAFSLIGITTLAIGISYVFTGIARIKRACKKISKEISNTFGIINDDNVAQFTKVCFSETAPRRLREAWVQYLGVRFGYPSDIISRERVYDREIGANKNIRAFIFLAISMFLVGLLSFFAMGTDYRSKLGVLAGIAIVVVGIIFFFFVLMNKLEQVRALKAFESMQDDIDASVQLQIEKDYAADSSPLSELATIVDEIVAKNLSKDVKEKAYNGDPTESIDILLKANAALGSEEKKEQVETIEDEIQEVEEDSNTIEEENVTNNEDSVIIDSVGSFIENINNKEEITEVDSVIDDIQNTVSSLPEEEIRNIPDISSEEEISIENIGNAIREGNTNEQYIKQLDEQIIEEDEDMFGWKKKEKKEELSDQEKTNEVELEEVSIEPEVAEKVDLEQRPEDVTEPNIGFDYAEAQEAQEADVVEEATKEEAIEENPVEEKQEENTPEVPVEEISTTEDSVVAETEKMLEEEEIEEIFEPTEEEIKAVEEIEAEEAAIDDDEDFTPPRFAKLPQLVNFMCTSDKFSRSVKIKMCLFLLKAYKSFKDKPEEKIIILTCLVRIIVSLKAKK